MKAVFSVIAVLFFSIAARTDEPILHLSGLTDQQILELGLMDRLGDCIIAPQIGFFDMTAATARKHTRLIIRTHGLGHSQLSHEEYDISTDEGRKDIVSLVRTNVKLNGICGAGVTE